MLSDNPPTETYCLLTEHAVSDLDHPDCPGGVIVFGLYQKHTASPVVRRTHRKVSGMAWCQSTGAAIPAMAWTRDMERAFRRLRRITPREPTRFRLRRRFVIGVSIVLVVLAALGVGAWFVLTQTEGRWSADGGFGAAQARIAEVTGDPSPGDRIHVFERATPETVVMRWYIVRSADGDTVTLQPYDTATDYEMDAADLDPSRFSAPAVSADRARLVDGILAADGGMVVIDDALPAASADD